MWNQPLQGTNDDLGEYIFAMITKIVTETTPSYMSTRSVEMNSHVHVQIQTVNLSKYFM